MVKKMKKSLLAIILIFALTLTCFVGCGNGTSGDQEEGGSELPTYHFDIGTMFINPEASQTLMQKELLWLNMQRS